MSDNIKVVVKVRPLISREVEEKLSYQWRVKNNTLYQLDHSGRDYGASFTFDKVYDKDTKTSDIYNDIAKPIVEAATAGFNGTIFAYGQTSSGKTYTMTGTEDSPGIIPLAVFNLFEIIKNIPGRDFLVRVSYIEIYNETLKDLLNVDKKNIKVHENFHGIKVDCTEQVTTSPDEVLKYLKEGEANRQTGATNMNEESSRSHSIFQITIESREHIEGEEEVGCVNVSTLNLVDLAGSERAGQTGATGIRFREGTHINKSLSALALVIKQLSEDQTKHVNYRDSKLTRILQNSLGGNAKTSIICAITPAAVEETISTLQFANRAKAIKNKPEVNAVATDATMIQSLTKQLSRLQSQLESKKNLEVMLESKKNVEQDNYNLQKQIAALQRLILNGFGTRSSIDMMGSRRKLVPPRRITISTLHSIEEDPVPILPKYQTPLLKYNPMLLPNAADFVPIQNTSKLSRVSEESENRLITPPPTDKKVNFNDEIIELDSDDETSTSDIQTCSPYHKCYGSSKTPPCILRKNAKLAEKNLKDIVELTEREKIYTPSVIELIQQIEQHTSVITGLQDEVEALHKKSKDKDLEIDQLRVKVSKTNEEIKSVNTTKAELEALCKEYTTKLTDWEVSYETLKNRTKRREEELLSLLEEQKVLIANKKLEDLSKPIPKTIDKEINFMDMSKDISLVNSDNESSIVNTNDDESCSQFQDLVTDLQNQLKSKNEAVLQLEAELQSQKQAIASLENSSHQLQNTVDSFKEKFALLDNENSLLKSTIETLNSTIKNQKSNLESAHNDIESYNSLIQELQIKLTNKERILNLNINEATIESMIANEEKFIANNDNMKNIIHCFKQALDSRNKEIESLKSTVTNGSTFDNDLKEQLCVKDKEITDLNNKLKSLQHLIDENIALIDKLKQENKDLIIDKDQLVNRITEIKAQNDKLEKINDENQTCLNALEESNKKLTCIVAEKKITEEELAKTNEELNVKLNELKLQIDDNLSHIDKLMQEKNNFTTVEHQLIAKISNINEQNDKLVKLNEENTITLNALEESNNRLTNIVTEKEKIEEELARKNIELNDKLNQYSVKITDLERDICSKDVIINSLNKEDQQTQIHHQKANAVLQSIQNSLVKFGLELHDRAESEDDIFTILEYKFNIFESKVNELLTTKDADIRNQIELIENLEKVNKELTTEVNDLRPKLTQATENLDLSKKLVSQITDEHREIKRQLEEKNIEIEELNLNLNESKKENEKLRCDILEIQTTKQRREENDINFENRVEDLTLALESKNKVINEKDKLIDDLSQTLENLKKDSESKIFEIEAISKKLQKNVDSETSRLECIFEQVSKLFESLNIEVQFNNNCEVTVYENILDKLRTISNYVNNIKYEKSEENVEILSEARKEVECLRVYNSSLLEKLADTESRNDMLSRELDEIKSQNKYLNDDLIKGNKSIEQLRNELKEKAMDIEIMVTKTRDLNDHFRGLDSVMKDQLKELTADNETLKARCAELESTKNDEESSNVCKDDIYSVDSRTVTLSRCDTTSQINITDNKSPPSLLTICCNKIIDAIQPSENSTTTTSSEMSIPYKDLETRPCKCEELCSELKHAQSELRRITALVQQQESHIQCLIAEREAVRGEVELLLEPAYELQKKINSHKTNLSTLTATTYAENKSLKSQVTVLQHHHSRFHHVCQRDLPVVKKQLCELMTILKSDNSYLDKHNASFKRYSLPSVLDNSASLNSLKNESTLDGDLLMLDTNMTLATSADNTLLGIDQTCLDITQICSNNDVACQTTTPSDDSKYNNEVYLTHDAEISQMNRLSDENKIISQKVNILEQENEELKKQLQQHSSSTVCSANVQTSPIKTDNIYKECENCKCYADKLKVLEEKIESMSRELIEVNSLKKDFEEKYNNLILEMPNTEALIRKLNAFEKDCQKKCDEILRLSNSINAKNLQLKQLEQENDSLSTQVMENITETDDLTKQLDNLKEENAKLTEKCNHIENLLKEAEKEETSFTPNCPHCQTSAINTNVEIHAKLNRSLSDSETSSRHNKICTLQNELHAGRQDCKELTEEVATIKSHLERSNLSIGQNMDLDDSMGESNIFTFTKHFETVDLPPHKLNTSNVQKDRQIDFYASDKTDCINYYVEKTGANKENLNVNMKIVDLMKMFYNDFLTKHSNEVENFVNKVKCYEESRNQLETHVSEISREYSKVKDLLEVKENSIKTVTDTLSQIRQNITLISEEMTNLNDSDNKNLKIVNIFKEKLLRVLDSGFDLTSASLFEKIIDAVASKHQSDLSHITEQYTKLLEHMESVSAELNSVNDNLLQMKCQLSDKENEYNLLKAQKERVHEISNAVTLDIVRKEQELCETIVNGCKKLVEHKIMCSGDFDLTIPLNKNINLLFERIITECNPSSSDAEKENLILEVKKSKLDLEESKKALEVIKVENDNLKEINKTVTLNLVDVENQLQSQKASVENVNKMYESTVKENEANVDKINQMTNELCLIKESLTEKENIINKLESESGVEIIEVINKIVSYKQEIDHLKTVNDIITKEKEACALELEKCKESLKTNNTELDNMTSDILVLRESVKENISIIENLKVEAKSLLQQNLELKGQLEEKVKDCSRLEMNIKTHEKTAEIQSRMIMRLQKQKTDDDNTIDEKNKRIDDLIQKYADLEKECEAMKNNIKASREEIERLKNDKESLEVRLSDLELDLVNVHKPRASIEADSTRRRRQSIHDSRRTFLENCADHNKIEAVFDARPKPQDLFMDVDEDCSDRSTPVRSSRGRDSLLSRHEQSDRDDDPPSRPSSVAAVRRRRQSTHDLHRTGVRHSNSPHERPSSRQNNSTDIKSSDGDNNNIQSEVVQLREKLSSCQQELEELKERFREVDEECEICSQYLREREEQCLQLKKEKAALTNAISELQEKLQSVNPNRSQQECKRSYADATVNTDEDWANLHSVVVDRMSFDAEVEKNKRLTKTIEELRYKKQDLKNTLAKMQKALERNASRDHSYSKELEITKLELKACKQELKELREKYKELDLECDTCSQYLREKEEQCRKLKEAKAILEAKLQDYLDNSGAISQSVRKKRQSLHDQNRRPAADFSDAATETSDDFLSYQVERDDDTHTKELRRLKLTIDKLSQQKASLEHQLISASSASANPVYISTGSAIVQNQQITDVMKENQKLKKVNAKLIQICKKRGKKPDVDSQDISEQA